MTLASAAIATALLLATATGTSRAADKDAKEPKPLTITGEIVKIVEGNITINVKGKDAQGGRDETVSINATTLLQKETAENEEVVNEKGSKTTKPRLAPIKVEDIQIAQKAQVKYLDGTALEFKVLRAPATKGDKDPKKDGKKKKKDTAQAE
jgi:hypothetical protein